MPCESGTYHTDTTTPLAVGTEYADCTTCEPGRYCPTIGLKSSTRCSSGYFCDTGSVFSAPSAEVGCSVGSGDICPEGSSCPTGTESAEDCGNGLYTPAVGYSSCNSCPKGFQCQDRITLGICDVNAYCEKGREPSFCDAGEYSPNTRGTSRNACAKCLVGHSCSGGAAPGGNPVPCNRGEWCYRAAAAEVCDPGQYCPPETINPLLCPPGKNCDDPAIEPELCDPGSYCDSTSDTGVEDCPRGHYCNNDQVYPQQCGLGTYNSDTNQDDVSNCLSCGDGRYCPEVATDQSPTLRCDDGFYCADDTDNYQPNRYPCEPGTYCQNGVKVDCDDGEYTSDHKSEECVPCPDGYLCPSSEKTKPTACDQSGYCSNNVATTCPAGTFRDIKFGTDESDCFSCNAGRYCENGQDAGACDAGYFCTMNANSNEPDDIVFREDAFECPKGYYCTDGIEKTPCPVGTFNDLTKQNDILSCQNCDHCPYEHMETDGSCPAGYTCESGTPELCNPGHYCEEGTNQQLCDPGYWSDLFGLKSADECYQCPEGFTCPSADRPLDTYAKVETNSCPEGTYCRTGTSSTTGTPCDLGYQCPEGSSTYMECEPNKYSEAQSSSCTFCEESFACVYDDGDIRQSEKIDCPLGYYCPDVSSEPTTNGTHPCSIGRYGSASNAISNNDCVECDAGYYCDEPGMTIVDLKECGLGSYCERGCSSEAPSNCPSANFEGGSCPVGEYCTDGNNEVCDDDKYTATTGSRACLTCPSGYVCSGGNRQPCPFGNYCDGEQVECPTGTYNNYNFAMKEADCIDCPAGKYCDQLGMVDTTTAVDCIEKFYCKGGSSREDEEECTNGEICDVGSKFPVACPHGYQCDGTTTTVDCDAGSYCTVSDGRSTVEQCPAGHYCDGTVTSEFPISCPRGTESFQRGGATLDDCTDCSNTVCDAVGIGSVLNSVDRDCYDGYSCESGATKQDFEKCPTGSMCTGQNDRNDARISSVGNGTGKNRGGEKF